MRAHVQASRCLPASLSRHGAIAATGGTRENEGGRDADGQSAPAQGNTGKTSGEGGADSRHVRSGAVPGRRNPLPQGKGAAADRSSRLPCEAVVRDAVEDVRSQRVVVRQAGMVEGGLQRHTQTPHHALRPGVADGGEGHDTGQAKLPEGEGETGAGRFGGITAPPNRDVPAANRLRYRERRAGLRADAAPRNP